MNMDDLNPEPEAPLPPHILHPLVPEARWTSTRLAGQLLDPIKTTVVQDQRSMTTWVVRKN